MLSVTVTSVPGLPYRHELKARSHILFSDVDALYKGKDTGPNPHEFFLLSLGTCTAITLELYAARKNWTIGQVKVTVTEDKIEDPNNAGLQIPHIIQTVEIDGNLSAAQLATLKEIGERCPVKKLASEPKVIDLQVNLSTSQ